VGGGPAGSSCAWALRDSGLDVLVIDRAIFPRDKVCAGWITPSVVTTLKIDVSEYSKGRVFQPISTFHISCMGEKPVAVHFDEPISYGIRRCEFDTFLLRRCGTRVQEGVPLKSIEKNDDTWIINGEIRTRMLVGAGGHFCPVARHLSGKSDGEGLVVAQESEFELDSKQARCCETAEGSVDLYFSRDLKGYGWVFRKQNFLNVGLGRLDGHNLPAHFSQFWNDYGDTVGVPDLPAGSVRGHAYLLFGYSKRKLVDDGIMLIGDAVGLAATHSGEGIRPAIESGILAAKTIVDAQSDYRRERLSSYSSSIQNSFGEHPEFLSKMSDYLPQGVRSAVGRQLLRSQRFCREVVVKDWFCNVRD